MAQAPVQRTPSELSLLEARELVRQKYLSPARAGQLLVEWLHAKLVRWRYADIQNNSGVSTGTVLNEFWQPAGLATDWEGSSAARRVAPPPVAGARGGVMPGGMTWAVHGRTTQPPSSQLGNNFVVYGVRVTRADIVLRLAESDEPVANPASPPASVAEALMSPQAWFREALQNHPRQRGEGKMDYARRLHGLMETAPVTKVWKLTALRRRLDD